MRVVVAAESERRCGRRLSTEEEGDLGRGTRSSCRRVEAAGALWLRDTEDECEATGKFGAGREQGAAARSLRSYAGEQEEEGVRPPGCRRQRAAPSMRRLGEWLAGGGMQVWVCGCPAGNGLAGEVGKDRRWEKSD
jgi:hypothetical protein